MQHPLNRHLFIADNLNLLRRLDNESIDLICIDPPFAKNQIFTGSLKPPLTDAERQLERETLAAGAYTPPPTPPRPVSNGPTAKTTPSFKTSGVGKATSTRTGLAALRTITRPLPQS